MFCLHCLEEMVERKKIMLIAGCALCVVGGALCALSSHAAEPISHTELETLASGAVVSLVQNQLVHIQGGTFAMGSTNYEANEAPVHTVTLDSFFMLNTEVTQAVYDTVMGENLSHFRGFDRPVEEVSWYDAVVFCNKLSVLSGLEPAYSLSGTTDTALWGEIPRIADSAETKAQWNGITCNFLANGYRLPTEAEWEYAATGGASHLAHLYSGSNSVVAVAWNGDDPDGETHSVRTKAPNSLGLYDMSGNVWEWCWDWYGNYAAPAVQNPQGADAEITGRKIRRGGSISSAAVFCRAANRASSEPDIRGIDLGFRVVRSDTGETFVNATSTAALESAPLKSGAFEEPEAEFDLVEDISELSTFEK